MRTDRITVDGVTLESRWIGPGPADAPTIVMLHEGLGSAGLWGRFPDELARVSGCGVFAYSRAGYGRSDPIALPRPLSYMHDEALGVLPNLLSVIGFERGVLLGHSDGASIATIYAGGVEDHRVRGLILLAPHFFAEELGIRSIEQARSAYQDGDLRERLARHHGDNVDTAFWGWNRAWLDPEFRGWDIRESLGYIRVPILIVQGTADQYGTTAQIVAAQEETYCPVDVALIDGAGHAPHLERPVETVAAVAIFLETLLVTMGEGARSAAGDSTP
jgi:pimeloyl-ACP methyl ester carboxylesterase